jgi:hypothetical protein
MAMRDPGTPGRNPFFDHAPDAELGPDLGPEPDALGETAAFEAEVRAAGFDPADWGVGEDDAPRSWPGGGGGGDLLGGLATLVDALQGAQPEATEHLVTAAHELVLAVKTVVDATEAALAAQRESLTVSRSDASPGADGTAAQPAQPAQPEPPTSPPSGVRRIDLA